MLKMPVNPNQPTNKRCFSMQNAKPYHISC